VSEEITLEFAIMDCQRNDKVSAKKVERGARKGENEKKKAHMHKYIHNYSVHT